MKKLLLLLLLYSCGNSRNDLMTNLLNAKKTTEDSISFYRNSESYYYQKAREAMRADTTKVQSLIDSNTISSMNARRLSIRLKELSFSIDSLNQMK